jgi:hypothetical protein
VIRELGVGPVSGGQDRERLVISSLEKAKRARERDHCVLKSLRLVSLGEVIGTALKRVVPVAAGVDVLGGVVVAMLARQRTGKREKRKERIRWSAARVV